MLRRCFSDATRSNNRATPRMNAFLLAALLCALVFSGELICVRQDGAPPSAGQRLGEQTFPSHRGFLLTQRRAQPTRQPSRRLIIVSRSETLQFARRQSTLCLSWTTRIRFETPTTRFGKRRACALRSALAGTKAACTPSAVGVCTFASCAVRRNATRWPLTRLPTRHTRHTLAILCA